MMFRTPPRNVRDISATSLPHVCRCVQPVREVTLSIWKAMLHLRRAWLAAPLLLPPRAAGSGPAFCPSDRSGNMDMDRSPPWDDPAALEYWVRAWMAGGSSGPAGDTLHRCGGYGV